MLKLKAIDLLGGTVSAAAEAIGISYQAVDKWPDVLPPRIADRVVAAMNRRGVLVSSDDLSSDLSQLSGRPCIDVAAQAGEGA